MRVTQVCLDYAPSSGGTTTLITNFHQVFNSFILTFISRVEADKIITRDDVFVIPTVSGPLGDQYALALPGVLKRAGNLISESDLLVCHMLFRHHIQWATKIAQRNGIPYWVVPHGSLDPFVFTYRSGRKWLWMRLLGKSILRKAAFVIFATENEKRKALMQFPKMNAVVVHWPVTVSHEVLAHKSESRSRVRALFGISTTDRVLLYVGRLHESKRPLQTIEAFGQVGRTDLHLLMVGPDETLTREECTRYAFEHKIPNLHMIGPVYGTEKFDYYMAADGYISLSAKENFGYTVGEALACGLPVILSPGIDLAAELTTLRCGWLLNSWDPKEILDTIKEFSQVSQRQLEEMGKRGQQWARTELSMERFHSAISDLMNESVAKNHI